MDNVIICGNMCNNEQMLMESYYDADTKSWMCGWCGEEIYFGLIVNSGLMDLGYSVAMLAKKFGVSTTTIRRWKYGEQTPNIKMQRRVAAFLKLGAKRAFL
jgi:DNA-binding XRE family transcriptional regulator